VSRHRFGAAWVLGLALVVLAGIVPVGAATPVQVSEGTELSWASTGAAAGTGASLSVVYVAPGDAGYGPVRLRGSKDGGATFLPSILISDAGTTDNHSASGAAAGSSVHVLWVVGSGAAERAWLRTSRDGGATWSPSVPVTPPGVSLGEPGYLPRVSASSSRTPTSSRTGCCSGGAPIGAQHSRRPSISAQAVSRFGRRWPSARA
jgi:hypothetical protein